MKAIKCVFVVCFLCIGFEHDLSAQIKEIEERWNQQLDTGKIDPKKPMYLSITTNELNDLIINLPDFGLYKDNYFITGVPTNMPVNNQTADAKFQLSIRQRLFNSVMPFNTQLMLIYTQKSFWDIYQESSPFKDSNYNPGLLLTKPIIDDNKMKGVVSFSLEHESNGRDSLDSRSWNYFTISGTYFFNYNSWIQAKLWHGKISEDNADLADYRGYGLLALNYRSKDDRFTASFVFNPTKNFSANTQFELSYQLNKRANQSLFFQWYNGYGESLLDYNAYTSMIRVGICIKSPLMNIY